MPRPSFRRRTDDLSRVAYLHEPRETEGTTSHVLDEALDTRLIARRQKHRLVDTETAVLPSPHVQGDFRLDLLLGQVQLEDRVLPSKQESLHVELRQLQKLALGRPRAAGDQHVDVRMPMQKFAMRLNRRNHSGHDILAPEQPLCFRLEAGPGTRGKFAQQLAIELRVNSQALGNGQDNLPMRDRRADNFGNVDRGQ